MVVFRRIVLPSSSLSKNNPNKKSARSRGHAESCEHSLNAACGAATGAHGSATLPEEPPQNKQNKYRNVTDRLGRVGSIRELPAVLTHFFREGVLNFTSVEFEVLTAVVMNSTGI
jgi:hypothetical protein